MGKTLVYDFLAGIALLVHGEVPPSDEDWNAYVAALGERLPSLRGVLVVTDASGPNSPQRIRINALLKDRPDGFPTAVISHSLVVRGILTALGLLNSQIRAFSPATLTGALAYLRVDPTSREAVMRRIVELRFNMASLERGTADAAIEDTLVQLERLMTERLPALRARLATRRAA